MGQNQLSCRLIRACNLAYKIDYSQPASAQPQEVAELLAEIGLIPDTLKFIEIGTDACAFAETKDEAILVFRGTLPPQLAPQDLTLFFKVLKDWLDNGNILLVRGENLPGRVHYGFLTSLNTLWASIQTFIAGTSKPLCVTGHSKGGALTFLASYRLAKTAMKPKAVCSFAAPRAGNAAFAAAYDTELPETVRVEYRDDLVPHLPASTGAWLKILNAHEAVNKMFPSEVPHLQTGSELAKDFEDIVGKLRHQLDGKLDYASAGVLQFLDWSTPPEVLPDSRLLTLRRAISLAEKAAEFKFDEIIEDHFSNGGYLTSTCGQAGPLT